MNKYIIALTLSFLVCFISCNFKRKPVFNEHLIANISNASTDLPSHYSEIKFFCKSQDNKIILLDANEFRYIYSKEYSKLDYRSFLTKLLNQELAIEHYNDKKKFKIDDDVEKHYLSMDIKDFLNYYCKKLNEDEYSLKPDIVENQRNSIFYFLFINNYQTSFDDVGGFYIIKKIEI